MANQFIIKNTMAEMRSTTASEIKDIQDGTYNGILLLGYYQKEDTPGPIVYFLSVTGDLDDGGSVIEIAGIKLEHKFVGEVDVKYFGAISQLNVNQSVVINRAIQKSRNISIDQNYYIDCSGDGSGLLLLSNSTISFKGNGALTGIPTASTNYKIINIYNCLNVNVINPKIIGERNGHIGSTGEWGHGISITNSENIVIDNPYIKDCWGDAIYIGNQYWDTISTISTNNITVNNAVINNVRRNGISITSNKNVTLNNPKIYNTNGTAPQAGIDIEPEGLDGLPVVVDNIIINNPYTENNIGSGIMLFLTNAIKLQNNPKIDINILNHIDLKSKHGLFIPGVIDGLKGAVNVLNPIYTNNNEGAILISNYGKEDTLLLNIESPILRNWNTSRSTFDLYKHAINIIKEDNTETYRNIGITINKPYFDFTSKGDFSSFIFYCLSSNPNYKSIVINDISGVTYGAKIMNIVQGCLVYDKRNVLTGDYWEETSLINFVRRGRFLTNYTNKNLANNPLFRIQGTDWTNGQRVSFVVEKQGSYLTIVSDNNNIRPQTYGGNLSSRDIGEKITLEFNDGYWFIAEKLGTWTNADRSSDITLISLTEPFPLPPNGIWIDVTNNNIKKRNLSNNGWDPMA